MISSTPFGCGRNFTKANGAASRLGLGPSGLGLGPSGLGLGPSGLGSALRALASEASLQALNKPIFES